VKKWMAMVMFVSSWVPLVCRAQTADEPSSGDDVRYDFVLNAYPASILVDVNGKKLTVGDTEVSQLFYTPNIAAGLGISKADWSVDITAGGGLMVNDQVRSFLLQETISASYAFANMFTMGPRAGLVQFVDPEWEDNNDISLDGATGYLVGLQMAMGDKISYLLSIDYVGATLDVKDPKPGVDVSNDELEIEGLMFQFGVSGRF
jgi:hypothetical protein